MIQEEQLPRLVIGKDSVVSKERVPSVGNGSGPVLVWGVHYTKTDKRPTSSTAFS